MTAKSKDQIKAFFETGDNPTESQFIDFIDSYVDKSGPLGDIETAASAGSQGFAFASAMHGEVKGASDSRSFMGITVYTTALAQTAALGLVATTAQASAASSNELLMTPFLTKYVIDDQIVTASPITRGRIEVATTAEFTTGTDTERAVTPSVIKTSLGYSNRFKSTSQTITAGGTLTIPHGLGANPEMADSYIQCTTGEQGFSIGDRLRTKDLIYTQNSVANYNYQYTTDATNIVIQFGAGGLLAKNKSTGAVTALTDGSWVLVVMGWA